MKKLFKTFAPIVLLQLMWVAKAQAEPLIGYVSLRRAVLEVEEGKRAQAALQKTFEKKKQSLAAKDKELAAMKEALDKQSVVKQENAATQARREEFKQKAMELQQALMKEQAELQSLEQKELAAITKKMREIIDVIGKEGGYTLILESDDARLLFARPHLDLTNEVIRKYNAKFK